jgi:hypothetical protein
MTAYYVGNLSAAVVSVVLLLWTLRFKRTVG